MDFLVSKLTGLRVLCGESITSCLPLHLIFPASAVKDGDEDDDNSTAVPAMTTEGNRSNRGSHDGGAVTMPRSAETKIAAEQLEEEKKLQEEEEEEHNHEEEMGDAWLPAASSKPLI